MGALLKRLWTDPVYFVQCVRGGIATLGALIASGVLGPTLTTKYGLIAMGISQFITTPVSSVEKDRVVVEKKEAKQP